jgi:hypothetical protein
MNGSFDASYTIFSVQGEKWFTRVTGPGLV